MFLSRGSNEVSRATDRAALGRGLRQKEGSGGHLRTWPSAWAAGEQLAGGY